MRVVLDSNVWVSALLFKGIPRQLLILATQQKIQIFTSPQLLDELEQVLDYPKLQKQIQRLDISADELMMTVRQIVFLCPTTPIAPVPQLRDPDDLVVLQTPVAAQANIIVSGDNDLLILKNFQGIQILNVADFLECYFPDSL